jgi:hypothetical protein
VVTEQHVDTRDEARRRARITLEELVRDAIQRVGADADRNGDAIDLEDWKGVPVVTEKDLRQAILAAFSEPLPPPAEHTVEVSTPATVLVTAFCPRCRQPVLMELSEVEPDLIVHSNGSAELKLKAKTKPRAHVCGQMPLPVNRNGTTDQMTAFDPTGDSPDVVDDEQLALGAGESDGAPPPAVVHDLLLLIKDALPGTMPSLAAIEAWDDDTRAEVVRWAGAIHLHASDHDDVEIPPTPGVLAKPEPLPDETDVRPKGEVNPDLLRGEAERSSTDLDDLPF